MDQKITVGNVCFILDEDKILLLKRYNEPMKGKYTGVGGKTKFLEDINLSCIREIKEETNLDVKEVTLKGVIKTILEGRNSSWILFIYTTTNFTNSLSNCSEGQLEWVKKDKILSKDLIGFIRCIIPCILEENEFIEGTVVHDMFGEVIEKTITSKLKDAEMLILN